MPEENESVEIEFDEIIEEKESFLERFSHIRKIPIYPQKLVIYPFEHLTLEISGAKAQQMIAYVKRKDSFVGISEDTGVPGVLPAAGTIGVGAHVDEIIETDLGSLQLVKIHGVVRYRLDEYVETDKPYPVARITFFEDDLETAVEKKLRPAVAAQYRELFKEFNRLAGRPKRLVDIPDYFGDEHL